MTHILIRLYARHDAQCFTCKTPQNISIAIWDLRHSASCVIYRYVPPIRAATHAGGPWWRGYRPRFGARRALIPRMKTLRRALGLTHEEFATRCR